MKITADSHEGRVLLALRAGPLSPDVLSDRWPTGHAMGKCVAKRLVEKVDGEYRLTAAGRAACPQRNPAAATVGTSPAGALSRRVAQATPVSAVTAPARAALVVQPSPKEMPMTKSDQPSTLDKIRVLLMQHPDGLSRKELLKHFTSAPSVDNAICILVKNGEARRLKYCWIAAIASVETTAQAPAAPVTPLPAVAHQALPAVASAQATPADADDEDIEFAIFNDGRLLIDATPVPITLNPKQTKRLAHFLGCFDPTPIPA